MKRVSLAVTSLVLYLIFFILYGISATRAFFSSLNSRIADMYTNLYAFFNFTWDKTLAHFIVYDASGLHHPIVYGLAQVFIWLFILILIIELIATIVVNIHRNSTAKYNAIIGNEKKNLLKRDDKPILLKENDKQGKFANNLAPYVSIDESLSPSSENVVVDPRVKKPRPAIRIILSIILFILTAIFIYLRMLWNFQYPGQYDLFYGLFHIDNIVNMNNELSAFFGALFQRAYTVPMATVAGLNWTWGDLFELVAIFLLVAIAWGIILLITHFVVVHQRKTKLKNTPIDIIDEDNLSSETISIMGNAELTSVGADVSYIAKITPSTIAKERNKQLHNQAMYIYDIGENVKSAGTVATTKGYIPPTEIRRPLVSEEMEEDLSGNLNVGLEDISSIEDSNEIEEVVNYSGYVGENEDLPRVDLENIDITSIATIQNKDEKRKKVHTDDDISFDEDGYAYLLKKGKPFVDEQADISDVIDSNDLQKSVIISRYGMENFEALNSLEPFDLKSLDYEEEIENIKIRKREMEIISADQLLRKTLSEKPFNEPKIEGLTDIDKNVLPTFEKPKPSTSYTDEKMNFTTESKKKSVEKERETEAAEDTGRKADTEKEKETKVKEESVKLPPKKTIQQSVKTVENNRNITSYNVPKVSNTNFKPGEKIDKTNITLIKAKEEGKSNASINDKEKLIIKPIKPIKPISSDITLNKKRPIKPIDVTDKNYVGSFADSIRNKREKNIGATDSSADKKVELVKFNKTIKDGEVSEKKDIKPIPLKSIPSIDKIEESKSTKGKPTKPIEAKKVGYDIFIGKKK